MNIDDGIKITEEQAVAVIAQNLKRVGESFYADPQYLSVFEAANGYALDSDKVSSDVKHFRIPMFAGAMMASAYLRLACKEMPDARLDRFWDKMMHSNINEMYGVKKYCDAARTWIQNEMKNKDLLRFCGGKPTGDRVTDKMSGISGLGALWLVTELAPNCDVVRKKAGIVFWCLHQKPVFTFTLLLSGLLDRLYGEPIPLPPPKKGFFGSLFG